VEIKKADRYEVFPEQSWAGFLTDHVFECCQPENKGDAIHNQASGSSDQAPAESSAMEGIILMVGVTCSVSPRGE
jgi:hypothetical protein